MLIAGEASGDTLAAELVGALRQELVAFQSAPTADPQPLRTSLDPVFFGAGGPKMAQAGVDLAFDLTAHSVFGFIEVFQKIARFRALLRHLTKLAVDRQPDVIVCVDFSGFNRRLAHAIRERVGTGSFHHWRPRIVQFVSPQVWASRPGRAPQMARDYDLLLSIFPFEKAWYAERVPEFRVDFVGHPMLDRFRPVTAATAAPKDSSPVVVLLPGSRPKELQRHVPVILAAARQIQRQVAATWRMVLPSQTLAEAVQPLLAGGPPVSLQVGGLDEALRQADLAIASSGTVTMECAFFGVPTVVLYKVSWPEFQLAKRIVSVKHIAMPNLLADERIFPEFLQEQATPEHLAQAALELLQDPTRRQVVRDKLGRVIASLGGPGAARRGARAIISLLGASPRPARIEFPHPKHVN